MTKDPTQRFSKTVSNYVKFRPGYPRGIISFMKDKLGMKRDAVIADIGSGTGKLTELFLKEDYAVYGVEPNDAMRQAGDDFMGHYPNFKSYDGTAEQTGLPDQSVDFIVAAQAFHWFKIPEARKEFLRILKPGAQVLLIWNKRVDEASGFMQAYNDYINQYSTDLKKVNLRFINHDDFQLFFGHSNYQLENLYDNIQIFDFEGLKGRYLSCSYALDREHPHYQEAMDKIKSIFDDNEENGKVNMVYRTEIHYGPLSK